MKYILHLVCFTMLPVFSLHGQAIISEDFNNGGIPSGWTVESLAIDSGWQVGSVEALSSQFFPIPTNNSGLVIATNDDRCNCNKSDDRLILPVVDLSFYESAILKFDIFYINGNYEGFQEEASIQVSRDGENWEEISNLEGHTGWRTEIIELDDYTGSDSLFISFHYNDMGGWLYGLVLDNISIKIPAELDIEIKEAYTVPYALVDEPYALSGLFLNNGSSIIQSLEVSLMVNGEEYGREVLPSFIIAPFESKKFELALSWGPEGVGYYNLELIVDTVNGTIDEDESNNHFAFEVDVYERITRQNRISELLSTDPRIVEIAGFQEMLNRPTDLDFFPILGKDELWVVNQRSDQIGGSTLTIEDVSSDSRTFFHRVDGNAWHFMSLPTGIAFSSENFNFAVSPGVQDANHNGGTFTGPALFSSSPFIYAQPSGGNGSHLDMLHGSPYSMGIAHEADNVFWVYDRWHRDIVRYDFMDDHGPGNDDHSDGRINRYSNLGLATDGDIPNHLVLDKSSGWLYFTDNGNDRVMRLNIHSGTTTEDLPLINEPLAEHSRIWGFTSEVVVEGGMESPCGIEIIDNLLLVGDYEDGRITVFQIDNDFELLGIIDTGVRGLSGIVVGPLGYIWYVNRIFNTLSKIEPGEVSSAVESTALRKLKIYPLPARDRLYIDHGFDHPQKIECEVYNAQGKLIDHLFLNDTPKEYNVEHLAKGIYNFKFQLADHVEFRRVIIL